MIKYNKVNRSVTCSIDNKVYSIDVIHKCFYWYMDKFSVDISSSNNIFTVNIQNINGDIDEKLFKQLSIKIKQDLIDFKTRDIITKETKNVRDLLIAKAFSNLDEE